MLPYLFVIFAALFRFLPHQYGFTPVIASLLFFGARGSRKQMWLPVALLIASDLLLNKFVYAYPLAADQYISWAWYAAVIWLGTTLKDRTSPIRVLGTALASSVSFFLISNFGVWAAYATYPKTWAGLMTCYAAGVPFFRRGLAGDLLFSAVLFGLPVVAAAVSRRLGKAHGGIAAA